MKNKISALFQILFVTALLLFLGLGFAKALLYPVDISQYEQRYAKKFPELTAQGYADGSFQTGVDEALGDQIAFSTYFKKFYNELSSHIDLVFRPLRHSIEDRYVAYKNLYLYNGKLLDKMSVSEDTLAQISASARYINEKAASMPGLDIYYYYVSRDVDMDFETGERSGIYERLRKELTLEEGNCACFEVNSFQDYCEFFYHTDHHWNHKGSYRAYLQLLEMLSLKHEALVPLEELTINGRFYGSRGVNVGSTTYTETVSAYRFDFPPMEISIGGETIPGYGASDLLLSGGSEAVSYSAIYGDDMGCMKIGTNRPERENILIIGDSYDNALLKLLASHFNETHCVDMRYYYYVTGEQLNLDEYISENDISKLLFIGADEFSCSITGMEG